MKNIAPDDRALFEEYVGKLLEMEQAELPLITYNTCQVEGILNKMHFFFIFFSKKAFFTKKHARILIRQHILCYPINLYFTVLLKSIQQLHYLCTKPLKL